MPIPGSPPISVIDPGTIPPPSTKSNSFIPVRHLGRASEAMSLRRDGGATEPPRAAADRGPADARGRGAAIGSSATAFQAPHASQRPAHFG